MERLSVALGDRSYGIYIGGGLLRSAGEHIREVYGGSRAAVITDDIVWGLYGSALTASLERADITFEPVVLPSGEGTKTLEALGIVLESLAKMGLTRSNLLIAFGGGVVGDIGGFAAGVYMRGIPYVQLPTTLLAQVDSSVGGKTAVNLTAGKNLAGVFKQPALVLADTELLRTLTSRDFAGGMGEVIKYGAIRSKALFDLLRAHSSREAIGPVLSGAIYACCDIKRAIVERDEFDSGERMLLNFGHTYGHGIEKLGRYAEFTHGEAVAIGMVMAAQYGEKLGLTPPGTARELKSLCGEFGLPADKKFTLPALLPFMAVDKKAAEGRLRLILLRAMGDAFVYETDMEALKEL